MFDFKWLYEFIIFIYCLSLIGYFIDFIQYNRKANRIAFWLLSMVWVLQTLFLLGEMLTYSNFPISTIYDGLYFYAWILVTFSLVINRLFRVDFFIFFTNVLGFFLMVLHIFTRANTDATEQSMRLVSELLVTHITLAMVSYGFFTFSCIFSFMYLLQYRLLKEKKWNKWLLRLGDLGKLDSLSYIAVVLGVPLLLIANILGMIWGYTSTDEFYIFDSKTLGSFVVLGVYLIYLFLRVVRGYQGRAMALYNTGAFLFLLVNFFLFGSLSNFHF
ncbi:cytochrome C assembly protein [Pontibacillus yanchengensis]|uniref:Cytochrome C assembly protein n=2 Tax=Pontibacillus yanchengensis TaxID=462910 RepID=A0ACC7VEE5_9BACI|nr:cytochrome c biogenesis protein [Pontibacillus yanchengensis]MYL34216.1 cytochrome C assembly protein [Pontibacillus yanchengensis]MYL53333.1 cytochrome C assembly protein [Pontibacillus yanchengensis]